MSIHAECRNTKGLVGAVMVVALLVTLAGGGAAFAQDQPLKVTPPQPTVPEVFTLMGQYVRMAYNNEGFATLGYVMAQEDIGKEWMLLSVGVTLRKPTEDYKLKREDLSITTPDGKKIPLATNDEYRSNAGAVNSLNRRAKVQKDSIDYFPLDATHPCALQFFADLGAASSFAYDWTELSWQRACVGRLFFRVPGGIQVGQHWLNIKFAGSELQVPFRTLTKDEAKQLSKSWKDLKKQLDATYQK
jgi:hypothetical protein